MLPPIAAVAIVLVVTQSLWVVARAFGPMRLALAPTDPRTLALAAVGGALAIVSQSSAMLALPALVAIAASCVSCTTDERTGLVFDVVTYPALALALVAASFAGEAASALVGAAVVGGAMLGLHVGTRGRGLGLGDVKLGAVVGAGFGVASGLTAIGAAFVVGACAAVGLLAARRIGRGAELRFAPYILSGVLLAAGKIV